MIRIGLKPHRHQAPNYSAPLIALPDSPNLLCELRVFKDLSPEDLGQIAQHASETCLPVGATLFRHGDQPKGLYIITSGILEVAVPKDPQQRNLPTNFMVRPYAYFGEMAIIENTPHRVTVSAVTRATLLTVASNDLADVLIRNPTIAIQILRTLTDYFRAQDHARIEHTLFQTMLSTLCLQ